MASRFASLHETTSLYHDKGFAGHGRQPGLFLNRPPKSIRVNTNPLIKSRGTRTDPAAETKSIGQPADASAGWRIMVFALPENSVIKMKLCGRQARGHSKDEFNNQVIVPIMFVLI